MLTANSLRLELDEFVRSGWMNYVLQVGGWWDSDGVLKPIRRSNLSRAYQQTRIALLDDLAVNPRLYRTLLLAEDCEPGSFLNTPQQFGRYWTSDPCVAHEYQPRRCYQTDHPMPKVGIAYVIRIDNVDMEDIDWIATIGCRLTNPSLDEIRLKAGVSKSATSISRAWSFDGTFVRSTPSVPGILPIAEGPGFIENLALLNTAEGRHLIR